MPLDAPMPKALMKRGIACYIVIGTLGTPLVPLTMTRNDRKPIPQRTADAVLYQADLLCCICETRGQHIHHIDNDPSNNAFDNLVLLCFAHHDEVTTRGGLQRRLTPSLLRKYRSALYR